MCDRDDWVVPSGGGLGSGLEVGWVRVSEVDRRVAAYARLLQNHGVGWRQRARELLA